MVQWVVVACQRVTCRSSFSAIQFQLAASGRSTRWSSLRSLLVDISPAGVMSTSARPFSRLPQCVQPTHYRLHLTPHLDTFRFDGRALISLQVTIHHSSFTIRHSPFTARHSFIRALVPAREPLWSMVKKGTVMPRTFKLALAPFVLGSRV